MPDDEQPKRDRPPAPDPLADYPVGPDDAGNAVMAAYAFAVRGRRWLVDRNSTEPLVGRFSRRRRRGRR